MDELPLFHLVKVYQKLSRGEDITNVDIAKVLYGSSLSTFLSTQKGFKEYPVYVGQRHDSAIKARSRRFAKYSSKQYLSPDYYTGSGYYQPKLRRKQQQRKKRKFSNKNYFATRYRFYRHRRRFRKYGI